MATTYNFDLLDLADGESGDAAVSVVVGKKKTEAAAAAKPADAAEQAGPVAQEKSKDFYYTKLQHDQGVRLCKQELRRLKDVQNKLRAEETKLKEKPAGNEARLKECSDEQRKLRQEQRQLRLVEAKLQQQKEAMVREYEKLNSHGANEDSGSNNDGSSCGYSDYGGNNDQYQTQVCNGDEHYPHGHDERQVGRGHYNNGDRQGYRRGPPRMVKVYRPKVKASSDAGTEAEEKPEASVVSANDTEQKDAIADNADAVPASESDKSAAGGPSQDGPNNGQGSTAGTKPSKQKATVNGSVKRKKKNAKKNSGTELDKGKKQDFEDVSKERADNPPLEEEKKFEQTLAEYERMCEEKKKSLEASKTEVRKVAAEGFKDMKMLGKKKLDDEETVIKVEKAQPKLKEASKKEEVVQAGGKEAADVKPKKVTIPHQSLGFKTPRRVTYNMEGGSFSRVHFNGSFQGGSRDNSIEPRVNGREPQNEAGGNVAPRSAYNAQGDGAMRGDYSGHRDGYMGNIRGNGRYGYDRGHGGYQGNGGYQQHQGGNVGRYQQERDGNGGNYQQRRNQQRRNFAPVLNVKDVYKFPPLPVPASARSTVPASETATAPAKKAAAPAQA
ncbi:unnamed protein product [Urochloa humidicola]